MFAGWASLVQESYKSNGALVQSDNHGPICPASSFPMGLWLQLRLHVAAASSKEIYTKGSQY